MSEKNHTVASINEDQAKVILQFLQRTNLQGSEMPAYVGVFNTLTAIAGLANSAGSETPAE